MYGTVHGAATNYFVQKMLFVISSDPIWLKILNLAGSTTLVNISIVILQKEDVILWPRICIGIAKQRTILLKLFSTFIRGTAGDSVQQCCRSVWKQRRSPQWDEPTCLIVLFSANYYCLPIYLYHKAAINMHYLNLLKTLNIINMELFCWNSLELIIGKYPDPGGH